MSKTFLYILGLLIIIAGIWVLIPSWQIADLSVPSWLAIVGIMIGLISVVVASADRDEM